MRSHLMSDVPLGLFLSGGIDSSGARRADGAAWCSEPLRTFSVGFAEARGQRAALRAAGRARGRAPSTARSSCRPQEFFEALPRLVWHEDEPIAFPSSVPLYFVSRLAREHVKVVLTGEGADELFLGYNRYRVTAWNERLGGPYWALTPAALRAACAGRVARAAARGSRRYARRSFLALRARAAALFFENFAVFPRRAAAARLLADAAPRRARDPYASGLRCYDEAPGGALDRMSHADLQTYLVELLMKQDQMSMAASIESRVPFLDHELVEHVAAHAGRAQAARLADQGGAARGAARPSCRRPILTRRKMGFPVPFGRWLRGRVRARRRGARARAARPAARALRSRPRCERLVASTARAPRNHGDRLWLLLNLEIWQRVFLDGEEPATGAARRLSHAHPLGEDRRALAARTRAAASAASTPSPSCRGGIG